jgi:hypothetical protein
MGIALVLDQGDLVDAHVALAKDNAIALGQPLGVDREHHRLGLHRGVDDHPGEVLRPHRLGAGGHCQALLQQSNELISSPIRWRQRVNEERSNTSRCWEELLAFYDVLCTAVYPDLTMKIGGYYEFTDILLRH